MEDFYVSFGARLRTARRAAGLSQADLAGRVGLSRTSITNIERGKQHPSLLLASVLAEHVGASLTELLAEISRVRQKGALNHRIEEKLEQYPERSREWIKDVVLSTSRGNKS